MGLRSFFSRTGRLWPLSKSQRAAGTEQSRQDQSAVSDTQVLAGGVPRSSKEQSLERLERIENGFGNMVGHLEGINKHLQSFPEFVENQKHMTEQLLEHIRSTSAKDRRLIEAIERLPEETARQNKRLMYVISAVMGFVALVFILLVGLVIYIGYIRQ